MVDCELAERDPGLCVCKGGPTLEILKDIQRLYEERLELIDRAGGSCKLKVRLDLAVLTVHNNVMCFISEI